MARIHSPINLQTIWLSRTHWSTVDSPVWLLTVGSSLFLVYSTEWLDQSTLSCNDINWGGWGVGLGGRVVGAIWNNDNDFTHIHQDCLVCIAFYGSSVPVKWPWITWVIRFDDMKKKKKTRANVMGYTACPVALLPTWFNFRYILTCPVKCGMKLLIGFQTSTVLALKFGNG